MLKKFLIFTLLSTGLLSTPYIARASSQSSEEPIEVNEMHVHFANISEIIKEYGLTKFAAESDTFYEEESDTSEDEATAETEPNTKSTCPICLLL